MFNTIITLEESSILAVFMIRQSQVAIVLLLLAFLQLTFIPEATFFRVLSMAEPDEPVVALTKAVSKSSSNLMLAMTLRGFPIKW